jgi:hypothetical protein
MFFDFKIYAPLHRSSSDEAVKFFSGNFPHGDMDARAHIGLTL